MELKLTLDTDELYGDDGFDFESLLSESLKRGIINDCKTGLASEKFKEFSRLVSDTIVAEIKLKMENFLSEEIALTEDWGKVKFVGSIEDLIKQRFDDVLLRSVDSSGKTLQGCTSSGTVWIEWRIKDILESRIKSLVETATKNIENEVVKTINQKITDIKDGALKQQVDAAFVKILKQ